MAESDFQKNQLEHSTNRGISRSKSSPGSLSTDQVKKALKKTPLTSTQDQSKLPSVKSESPDASQILEIEWMTSLNGTLDSSEWNCASQNDDLSSSSSSVSSSDGLSSETTVLLSSLSTSLVSEENDSEFEEPSSKKLKK